MNKFKETDRIQLGQLIRFKGHTLDVATKTVNIDVEARKSDLEDLKELLEEWKQIIRDRNGGSIRCKECGFDGERYFAAIDFHHRDPSQKESAIGILLKKKPTAERIAELEKCDIMCKNCHTILHFH